MPDAPAKPLPLSYARGRLQLRPWIKRGVLLAWLVLTAWLIYDKWALGVRLQWQLFQAERACRNFVEPPDRVVVEADPERADNLLLRDSLYRRVTFDYFDDKNGRRAPAVVSISADAPSDKLHEALGNMQWWDERNIPPAPPVGGFGLFGGGGDKGMGPRDRFDLFVHERRAAGGKPRLVHVTGYAFRDHTVGFRASVSAIGGPFGRNESITIPDEPHLNSAGPWLTLGSGKAVRLYAPQPDASDASRFIIPYDGADGAGGVVEGRLTADDHVVFQVLPGAATRTSR